MKGSALVLFVGVTIASPLSSVVSSRQAETINWATEYSTQCKTCPYELCTNISIENDNVTLSCWTEGEQIVDTNLWLRTSNNCYVTEYDLVEYTGDFRSDLDYCGKVPLDITEDDAEVKYLSECKWAASQYEESIEFLGRDKDLTVTCVVNGSAILDNEYWYKTYSNCYVSETGLYSAPDRDSLQDCGPQPYPRANETSGIPETSLMSTQTKIPRKFSRPANAKPKHKAASAKDAPQTHTKRWLQPEQIGEEYAPCLSCANSTQDCSTEKVYEFNQTVISQCVKSEDIIYPNGSFSSIYWMLTTDWCYVDSLNFWVPPYDNYRYPRCEYWGY